MTHTNPCPEGYFKMPDAAAGSKARQLQALTCFALGLVKDIDDNVHLLASRLHSITTGTTNGGRAVARRQGVAGNLVYEIYEKINGFTYTMTGLSDILKDLSVEGPETAGSIVALRELATAMKSSYDEMLSLADKL